MYQYQVAEILQKLDMIIDFFKMAEPRHGNTGYAIETAFKDALDEQSQIHYNNVHGDKEVTQRNLHGRREARKGKEEKGHIRFRRRSEDLREEPSSAPTISPAESSFIGW